MDLIKRVLAWEALDSRGTPTVACAVWLESGAEGAAVVPSGASTGSHEAFERRDGGERYAGKGVVGAVAALRAEIVPELVGRDAFDQIGVDAALRALDGTPNLRRLGANAVLAASVACAVAAARSMGIPLWQAVSSDKPPLLPLPMVNVISGGAHAGGLIDVQDFLVIPVGARTFAEAIEWASRVRAATAAVLREQGHDVVLVADEGGLAALLPSNRAALDVLLAGIESSGLEPVADAGIAVDVAATQLLVDGTYVLRARTADSAPPSSLTNSRAGSTTTRSSRSKTRSARTTRRAGGSPRRSSQAGSSCSATTCSPPRPPGWRQASARGLPTRYSSNRIRSGPSAMPAAS